MDEEAYKEYCRCWQVFLRRIHRDNDFAHHITQAAPVGMRIIRWPTVWPSVEHIFGTTERFVEAVQSAEKQIQCKERHDASR